MEIDLVSDFILRNRSSRLYSAHNLSETWLPTWSPTSLT